MLRIAFLFFLIVAGQILPSAAASRFNPGQRWLQVDTQALAFQNATVVFGDVNGDKRADVVIYARLAGVVTVGLSTGGGFGTPTIFADNVPRDQTGLSAIAIADVNGDGKGDLIIMNHGADNVSGAAIAQVALSTGSKFTLSAQPWNESWCATYQVCFAADLDNDRRADLVAFTPRAGAVFASTSSGQAFGANAIWNKYFCINSEVCAVGDVDGDGRVDAIAFKSDAQGVEKGNVLVSKSTGTGFASPQLGHGYFCIRPEQCYVGDVNGDGKSDIVAMKGYGGFTAQLEVLVSLSDGTRFVNPNPIIWANVPWITKNDAGMFAFADVNGDKRADMIQYGRLPRPANTSEAERLIANVFLSTDQAAGTPPPSTTPPPTYLGWSSVKAYNCAIDEKRIHLWTIDVQTGDSKQTGPVDALYNENSICPDGRDPPTTLSLTDGHTYRIVAVLPDSIGCEGRNDPNIVACAYSTLLVRAKAGGPTCHFYIGGQGAGCSLAATTFSLRRQSGSEPGDSQPARPAIPQTADGLLAGLMAANVDFSRRDINELKGWLGNPTFTPYPAISQALLGLTGMQRFIAPVQIDVIAYKYEPNQNASRPRAVVEVDTARLKKAILAASNERHGTKETDFTKLLAP